MTSKICTKCKKEQPLSCYFKRSASNDGLAYHCRDCFLITFRRWKEKNKVKYREYQRNYGRWWSKSPEEKVKARARQLIQRAKTEGRLNSLPCKVCGEKKAEAHHEDYSKPLDVVWLCPQHHVEVHLKVR